MVQFTATIKRFKKQGEKTGWTYIDVPAVIASKLKPGCKKSFRVSGSLDVHHIDRVALVPMGEGDFILAINADMRKGIQKTQGMQIDAQLHLDERAIKPPGDLIACLKDEPDAYAFYNTLAKSHQLYFGRWIDSAKTDPTRTKRIAQAVSALARQMGFPEMVREGKKFKEQI